MKIRTMPEDKISEEELNNLDKLDFHKALFLVRTLYRKIVDILECFCVGRAFAVRNEAMNFHYVLLKETLNQILKINGLEELKKEMPELFDSLIGDIEESDMDWEYGYSQQAYAFLGKIEDLFIKSGAKTFRLPQILENKLQEADKAMVDHVEYDNKLRGGMEKSIKGMKKELKNYGGELPETEEANTKNKQASKSIVVEFLDDEAIIKVGERKCQLPPYKNEHFFCRAAFEYPANEPIDWSVIYEKITGYYEGYYRKPPAVRKGWHMVYDTMEAINKRVKEVLGIEKLFVWQEKTVRRTQ